MSEEGLVFLIPNAAAIRTIFSTYEAPLLNFKALYKYQLIALNGSSAAAGEKKEHTVIGSLSFTAVEKCFSKK